MALRPSRGVRLTVQALAYLPAYIRQADAGSSDLWVRLCACSATSINQMISKTSGSNRPSIDEKKQADPEAILENVSTSASASSHDLDFGGDSQLPPPPKLTPEQEKKLYRKVDLWLMPILTLMYLASFLDRGIAITQNFGPSTDS